jgi:hypothetical protein
MKFFDKLRNQGGVLLVMRGTHNKVALLIFWSILARINLTNERIFAIRLMVRPPSVTRTIKGATHCKASAASFLFTYHVETVFDFCFNKMLTVKQKRMEASAKNTFFRRSGFWRGSVAAFPDSAAAATPILVCSVGPLPAFVLPTAAIRRTTATAVPALALGIRAVGGVWIHHHRNPRAQLGDLLITQLQ